MLSFFPVQSRLEAQSLPLYTPAPQGLLEKLPSLDDSRVIQNILTCTESGLYRITGGDLAVPLWTEGQVTHIERIQDDEGEKWFFITEKGLLTSRDLQSFERCDTSIPYHAVKTIDDGKVQLINQAQAFKDISVHPQDSSIIVTATKNMVYLSRDSGETWRNLGYSTNSSGTKAVAVANMSNPQGKPDLVVFLAHSLYGLYYFKPDDARPQWLSVSSGIDNLPTQGYSNEISDILPVVEQGPDGTETTTVYFSQTFSPTLYRLNWTEKKAERIYQGDKKLDTIDGLCWTGNNMIFTHPGGISVFNLQTSVISGDPSEFKNWEHFFKLVPEPVYSAYIPKNLSGFSTGLVLNELWMLKPEKIYSQYADVAMGKKSVYMPANRAANQAGIREYINLVTKNNLNSIVIDMKDDYGLLRYDTQDPRILEKCYISSYATKLNDFVAAFKEQDIYLIARIVVFKDKNLATYDKQQYAAWNQTTKSRWIGIKSYETVAQDNGQSVRRPEYYDEHWVDPYSEDVWEYNVWVAQELIRRGFDEIQFDYIRFPTDGLNLYQADYRWRRPGMDRDSAIISFLRYARANIAAPIGIDIYGANGWYRSGARTGQDVEMLADYVDVICPMFYPSHFEQIFLAQNPAQERPYRIYYYGTYRNTVIARNKVIVRPWAQAFKLDVSYDRTYYNKDYVIKQIYGVRDSVNRGYMYWNNSGRYEDISPDISDDEPYPGLEPGTLSPLR
ncbi:MAG: hypothetical protein LBS97_02725 [Treponema sp.]|nr:hypothetical protein [Treponema sp.]